MVACLYQKYTLNNLQLNVEVHAISSTTDPCSGSDAMGQDRVLPIPRWPESSTEGQRMLERRSRCELWCYCAAG